MQSATLMTALHSNFDDRVVGNWTELHSFLGVGIRCPFMMKKIPCTIDNQILSLKCSFCISYGIGWKYWSIWFSDSVLDLNQNSDYLYTMYTKEEPYLNIIQLPSIKQSGGTHHFNFWTQALRYHVGNLFLIFMLKTWLGKQKNCLVVRWVYGILGKYNFGRVSLSLFSVINKAFWPRHVQTENFCQNGKISARQDSIHKYGL